MAIPVPRGGRINFEDGEQPLLPASPYSPLPSNVNVQHIRLLELLPSLFGGELRGRLCTARLDACTFEALSYTWGGRTESRNLTLINGIEIPLTDNLYRALRKLRLKRRTRVLWIDAICIDQANTAEKSTQVSMMGEIYAAAQSTIIWLGDTSKTWSCSLKSILNIRQIYRSCKVPDVLLSEARVKVSWALYHLFFNHPQALEEALAETQPPWIGRTWTQQEYVLSRKCELVFGSRTLPNDGVALRALGTLAKDCKYYLPALGGFLNQWSYLRRLKERYHNQSLDLCIASELTGHTRAADGQDKIYGLLGLIRSTETRIIAVNYSAPVSELYARATYASLAIRGFQTIESLRSFRLLRRPGLPSWAIDFSSDSRMLWQDGQARRWGYNAFYRKAQRQDAKTIFGSTGQGQPVQLDESARYLTIEVLPLDTVRVVLPSWEEAQTAYKIEGYTSPTAFVLNTLDRSLSDDTYAYTTPRPNPDLSFHPRYRTWHETLTTPLIGILLHHVFNHWHARTNNENKSLFAPSPPPRTDDPTEIWPEPQTWLTQYLDYVSAIHGEFSILVLRTGLIALGSGDLHAGDCLVATQTARFPIVLRRCGECWTFHGFTYVYSLDFDGFLRNWEWRPRQKVVLC